MIWGVYLRTQGLKNILTSTVEKKNVTFKVKFRTVESFLEFNLEINKWFLMTPMILQRT